MNDCLVKARNIFIEALGQLSSSVRLSRVLGQLYGLLFLSDRPLCLDDIAQSLKISKGNVSINIRELVRWGAAKKVWVRGSRKDFYEAELDFRKIVNSRLTAGLNRRMEQASDVMAVTESMIEKAKDGLNEEDRKMASLYLERLSNMKKMQDFAGGILKNYLKI